MKKTAVIFSPVYYLHNTGPNHPESARRLQAIIQELQKSRLSGNENWQFVPPGKASLKDIELVHGIEYVKLVEAVCRSGGGLLDLQDTVTSHESFDTALYAVGGALKAVNLVLERKFENAFVLARPPGHHAGKFRACGFCIFNNVAVAARFLLQRMKLDRVLVLDVDAHHGNGTQETFYGTNRVLYVSLHEDPRSFPGTGFTDEIGEGEGVGYNVNVPLPYGTGDHMYLKAMNEIAVPIISQFKPQFTLVSAGFDAHHTDPVGNLTLSASCFQQIFKAIMRIASNLCHGRIVAILEGGYSLDFVGKLAAASVAEMCGASYVLKDKGPISSKLVGLQGAKILKEVKRVQRAFWHVD